MAFILFYHFFNCSYLFIGLCVNNRYHAFSVNSDIDFFLATVNRNTKWCINNLYFFKDNKESEVDIVLDQGISQRLVEVKSGQTVTPSFFKGLKYFSKLSSQ